MVRHPRRRRPASAVLAAGSALSLLLWFTPVPAEAGTPGWLSGAAGREAANGSFGTWRGSRVEIGQTWVNDPALYPLGPTIAGCGGCGEWANFTGPMSVSMSPPRWYGWAAEANGVNDAYWTALGRRLATLRAGKATTYANPYYEFSGDWMPWSVTRTEQGMADFRRGYARTSAILKREFPGVKLVLNAVGGRTVPDAMFPSSASFDVLGVDVYNEWPHDPDGSTFIDRVEAMRQQAYRRGKPLAIPEWGNSTAGSGGGGESPELINAFHSYLLRYGGKTRGRVLYETYFNIGGYTQRFELYPTTAQPQTAARYRDRF